MKRVFFFLFCTFCIGLNGQPTLKLASYPLETLDPRKCHSIFPAHVLRLLYERLVRFERDGKVHPAIAKTIEISNDKKIYTFHLRESCWSDGSPVLAEEFIEAWKESIASKTVYVKNWFCVKNGKQVVNGELPFDQLGVTSPDDNTIIIELEKPFSYFLELMEDVSCSPIKERIDLNTPEWASKCDANYICNGPFRIWSSKEDERLLLEKNPFYWDADSVQLTKISIVFISNTELLFDLFESGEIDWIGVPYFPKIENWSILKKNYPVFFTTPAKSGGLLCNVTTFPLSEVNLRKALSHAINRKQLCKLRDSDDLPAKSILLSEYSFKDYFSEEEDLKKARFYFDQFLRKSNQTPSSLSFTISAPKSYQQELEFIQHQWKTHLDIQAVIDICEPKKFCTNLNTGDYQLALSAITCKRYNDPTEQFDHFLSPISTQNLASWSNPAFIRLVHLAEDQTAPHIRSKLLAWAEEIMMEEIPQIPLIHPKGCYAKHPRLHNEFTMHAEHVDFRWAFFSESA